MVCPNCGSKMFIDTWGGWIWFCPICDYEGRDATEEEIKQDEEK